jgi:hypothetical protein
MPGTKTHRIYLLQNAQTFLVYMERSHMSASVSAFFHNLSCVYDFSGEEMYTCVWLKSRGVNVLEFQLGRLVCRLSGVSKHINSSVW